MADTDLIKDKINIVDLIADYLQLKKAGVNYKALCPFHQEKTPSFIVSPAKQIWHCFGCSSGGDIFEFIKQMEGVAFPEALQMLAARTGVTLKRPTVAYQAQADQKKILYDLNELAAKFYEKVLETSQAAQTARGYLAKRGFKLKTMKKWRIGFAPDEFHILENFLVKKGYQKKEAAAAGLLSENDGKYFDRFRGRIMFPLFDIHGRVAGFTGRVLKDQEGVSKYVNSPETLIYNKSQLIYGLNFAKTAIRQKDEVVVVEGNVDVITAHEFGYENTVGSSGTALTETQLTRLKRFASNMNLAFDVDEAGLAASRRAVELALAQGFNVRIINIPKELAKDPDELLRKDQTQWAELTEQAQLYLDFYFQQAFARIDLSSSSGKKQAVGELLPLLALLPHPIDRAHYAKELAVAAGIDERIIVDLLNKHSSRSSPAGQPTSSKNPSRIRQSVQHQSESRILGLLLNFAEDLRDEWDDLSVDDFSDPVLQSIFSEAAVVVKSGGFDLADFLQKHPRLKNTIELLVFGVENELMSLPDWNLADIQREFFAHFKRDRLKQKMRALANQIKGAEQIGQLGKARELSGEFNNLTRELQKYDG